MAFFYSFTDSLKQKWLNFYQNNRDWIALHMEVDSVYTPDGGKRPPSYLILGVVNALEPKLAQLMFPFSKLNVDADNLVEVLDLNFDPEMTLGNRIIPPVEVENEGDEGSVIPQEEEQAPDTSRLEGFDSPEESHNLNLVESADETLMVTDGLDNGNESTQEVSFEEVSASVEEEEDSFSDMNLSGLASEEEDKQSEISFSGLSNEQNTDLESENLSPESSESDVMDAFGDISFDNVEDTQTSSDISSDENDEAIASANSETFDEMNVSEDEDNGFGNVLMDVWGEESSVPDSDAENLEALNGEKSADSAFDDTDIARLFPNS